MLDAYLLIGEIVKPQGIRGELKLRPNTGDVSRFDGLNQVFLKRGDGYEPVSIDIVRIEPGAVYLRMEGITDRNGAERARGLALYIDRARAIPLSEDENFICDLIGLTARDDAGRDIGVLTDVMQPGGGDVYVFNGPMGEVLVPALKSVVLRVDIANRTMLLSARRLNEVAVFED